MNQSPVRDADRYRLPAPAERRRIRSTDGHWINTESYGPADAPLVVLAHGWTCAIAFWAPVIHQLAADHRVVAYDQRGHGRSDIPPTRHGYSTTALADDLEAVLTEMVPAGRRAVLAGHSMGGMTIMAAGDRTAVAERTAAVLLCSTGPADLPKQARLAPGWLPVGFRGLFHRQILTSRLPLGPVNQLAKRVLKFVVMGPQSGSDAVTACAQVVHACPTAVRAHWGRVLGELDVSAGLARIAAPTAVLVGTHDKLTPPPHVQTMLAALPEPDGHLLLPDVGHMSPVERPDEVAAELRRLVATHLPTERTDAA